MESSPQLPPMSSPPPQPAARDSDSPISDCIVVRDCDSSSVITLDTAITSIAPTSDASKGNSRAGSIPTQMDITEDTTSSSPSEAQLVPEVQLGVKLKIEQVPIKPSALEALETEKPRVQAETYLVAETEVEVKDEPELLVTSTPTQTRILRQRPPRLPPVVKSPRSTKKACQPAQEGNTVRKQLSPQLSEVIQIRDLAEMKEIKPEEGNRRRSSRLSLLSSNISKLVDTPKRDVGKRSHEVMAAGSKSADAKLGSRSWGKWQSCSKKVKAKESSEGEEDSSEEASSEEEEEEEEEDGDKQKKQKVWATQGLFVGQEDDFDNRRRTKRGRLSGAGALPKKRKPILPLPMPQGLELMDNRRDFKLPFNVFSPTPYRVHPPGWKSLSRSMYFFTFRVRPETPGVLLGIFRDIDWR